MRLSFLITGATLLLGCASIKRAETKKIISEDEIESVREQHRFFLLKEAEYAKRGIEIPTYDDLEIQLPETFGQRPPTSIWWAHDKEENIKFPERYFWNFTFGEDITLSEHMAKKIKCEIKDVDRTISSCRPKLGHFLNIEFWTEYDQNSGLSKTNISYAYKERDE